MNVSFFELIRKILKLWYTLNSLQKVRSVKSKSICNLDNS